MTTQTFLSDFTAAANDSLQRLSWLLERNQGRILAICDDERKYLGVVSRQQLYPWLELEGREGEGDPRAADICDKGHPVCVSNGDADVYASIRNMMADNLNLLYVPVLNENRELIDIFSRQRAFYLDFYQKGDLPKMTYAHIINRALFEAEALGYKAISVVEFGVAGGNGLVACEFHARELGRIYGIRVDVYGFDSGRGLPPAEDQVRDISYLWSQGLFAGDMERLKSRLRSAQLVIGQLAETAPSFMEKYRPAPIGAMAVDVDLYHSTVPVLKLFEGDFDFLMPRVYMYFDDVYSVNEFAGETLAIKEFNASHEDIKISPEHVSVGRPEHKFPNMKMCHNFKHPLYNKMVHHYGRRDPLLPLI